MISPPRRGDSYPGRLPPVRRQFRRLPPGLQVAAVAVPVVVVAAILAFSVVVGITFAVLVTGSAAATVVYTKNRTDRHNAAVDSGEIPVADDPRLEAVAPGEAPPEISGRMESVGLPGADLGRLVRFDGGWIAGVRGRRDRAVVVGDDGGWAWFDPRTVTDLWAVAEYRAGRGRDG